MEIIPAFPLGITRAIEVLRSGGVVAHATETCYGFACDLRNPDAAAKLFAVKKRPSDQPVSALFSSLEEARKFVVFSPKALELAEKYLPGPLTLVLPVREDAPFQIHVCPSTQPPIPNPTIGIRISSSPLAQNLAAAFGGPIATTSANLHGEPNPYSVSAIETQFLGIDPAPDLVIDSGTLPLSPPSTVVESIGESIRVLRQGETVI